MGKRYFVVHFSGHGKPKLNGARDQQAFGNLSGLLALGDVSRFCFYAGLGPASREVATNVLGIARGYAGSGADAVTYIVHGYSAGGITALHFAQKLPPRQLVYIGLSDVAFMRGESDSLMTTPGAAGYHASDNYYQTVDNAPSRAEIHGKISSPGWSNQVVAVSGGWFSGSPHDQAVRYGDKQIYEAMADVIRKNR